MRELIRPTVFLVARLGLFFAVVLWIVGQLVGATVSGNGSIPRCRADTVESGLLICLSTNSRLPQKSKFTPYRDLDHETQRAAFLEAVFLPDQHPAFIFDLKRDYWAVLGLTVFHGREHVLFVVSHWLIATIFVLFNGVLMWLYRKRGEELAADE